MKKNDEKKTGGFPVEFPSRSSENKRSPIVDVTENEIYPLDCKPLGSDFHGNCGIHIKSFDDVSEVIATETEPDTAGQTIHGQQT